MQTSFFTFAFIFTFILLCNAQSGYGSAKHVLVLGCDGLGADYLIQANNTPNFDSLRAQGSSTFRARNVWPTWSLPNWSAIMNSAGTEETGVPGNNWYDTHNCIPYGTVYKPECLVCELCETIATGLLVGFQYLPGLYNLTETELDQIVANQCAVLPFAQRKLCDQIGDSIVDFILTGGLVIDTNANEICQLSHLCAAFLKPVAGNMIPSFIGVAKQAKPGIKVAVYTDWTGINQIVEPNMIDYYRYANAGPPYRSSIIVEELIPVIENDTPEIVFIHFDDIDETGHANGWGSPPYYEAISLVDYEIGLLLNAYETAGILNETLVLVIADHGGQTAGHGFINQKNVAIPWIAKGPQVNVNYEITSYARSMDIPATALYALGVQQPPIWMGRPLSEIYTGSPYQWPSGPSSPYASTVVTVAISGLNSAGFQLALAPTLKHLIKNGAYASHARAQMPTTTMPNIASIIMGAGPEETGVCQGPFPDANSGTCYWNGVNDSAVPPITGPGKLFPSIFQILFQKGIQNTAAVYRYENITKVLESYVPQYLVSTDANVASQVSNLLKQSTPPAYIFAQFWDVQSAAVNSSYDGPSYLAAIAQVDSYISQIYNSLPSNALLIVTSDHGGVGAGINGDLNDRSIIVPFIAYGTNIKQNYRIPTYVRNMDAASISLYALGFQQPADWQGNYHTEIFQ